MKRLLFILLLLPGFTSQNANAQGWLWARGNTQATMDAWSVATDHWGNVFVAGVNYSGGGGIGAPAIFDTISVPFSVGSDGLQSIIAKYDSAGNILWAVGTQNSNTWLINITTDKNGNSYLFGAMNGPNMIIGTNTMINTTYPDTVYFIVKFDPSGNVLWAKNAGNAQFTSANATLGGGYDPLEIQSTGGIATDDRCNIYITANFHVPVITVGTYTLTNTNPLGTTDDMLVVKYDSSGDVIWATSSGGIDNDDAYGITVTPAGNVYIAGVFKSPSITFGSSTITDTSGGKDNAFIAEYNSLGTPVWANGSGGSGHEFALGIASDASNNVYLTGGVTDHSISFSDTVITNPYPGQPVLYLMKFDPFNNVRWHKTIGDPTGGMALGNSIAITMSPCDTSIWVGGQFTNLDSLTSSGFTIAEVSIDGYILHDPTGSPDPVFIAGFNEAGTYVGSMAVQSGGDDQCGIASDAYGNVFLCSDYSWNPFIIGADTFTALSGGPIELLYFAKYDPNLACTAVSLITGDSILCKGDTTTLSDTTTGGTWSSSNTSVAIVGSGTGTVTGLSVGVAIITYSVSSGYAIQTVSVNPSPSAIIGSTNVCVGFTDTLSDATIGGVWSSSSTGIATVGSSTGIVSGLSAGTVTITYLVSAGCYVTLSDTVYDCEAGVSTVTGNANQIGIFPNPASTQVTIMDKAGITTITISNLIGQTVYTREYNSQQVQVDVSNLPTGMYLVRINGSEVRKFVKQ